jgi:hypothetical protein
MPFLPSEEEETKLLINQQMKDFFIFITCPFCVPLPCSNDIENLVEKDHRYLNYMQAYKDLDIQVLPNNIVEELNLKKINS